ncbi:Keratin, type II cytoskeletal 8 [Myotis brandtii]|uniref:Keratin, type II cytoskeletal 8 n=1 Tax=Myotis brandtii TaxID=109478 RepID=S7NIY4_MYOBR|nr:Keratin, type II cytoskeletal 8 [Myotis brandtii]
MASGLQQPLNSSGPGTHISSLTFSKVGGSYRIGLGSSMNLAGDYGGAGSMESITALQVNQSLLSPLKLEVDSNIQARVQPGEGADQEPQQVCFLQ